MESIKLKAKIYDNSESEPESAINENEIMGNIEAIDCKPWWKDSEFSYDKERLKNYNQIMDEEKY